MLSLMAFMVDLLHEFMKMNAHFIHCCAAVKQIHKKSFSSAHIAMDISAMWRIGVGEFQKFAYESGAGGVKAVKNLR
jgi:hypothetical protein